MISIPYEIQVLILVFVIIGLVGWSFIRSKQTGIGPQPIWQTPEYLRYNQNVIF